MDRLREGGTGLSGDHVQGASHPCAVKTSSTVSVRAPSAAGLGGQGRTRRCPVRREHAAGGPSRVCPRRVRGQAEMDPTDESDYGG